MQDGDHQAARRIAGEAHVDGAVQFDDVVMEFAIEFGMLLQRLDDGEHDHVADIDVGQAELLALRLDFGAEGQQAADVRFGHERILRGRLEGFQKALRDDLADLREGLLRDNVLTGGGSRGNGGGGCGGRSGSSGGLAHVAGQNHAVRTSSGRGGGNASRQHGGGGGTQLRRIMIGGFHVRFHDASACASALDGRHDKRMLGDEFLRAGAHRGVVRRGGGNSGCRWGGGDRSRGGGCRSGGGSGFGSGGRRSGRAGRRQRAEIFAGVADDADRLKNGNQILLVAKQGQYSSAGRRFDLDRGLVGLNITDDVFFFDDITDFDTPLGQQAFFN